MGSKTIPLLISLLILDQSALSTFAQAGAAAPDSLFWTLGLVAVLIVLGGAGFFVYLRFRSGAAAEPDFDLGETTENANTRRSERKKSASLPVTRTELAQTALGDQGNFSKDYADSIDIDHLPISQIAGVTVPPLYDELPNSDDEDLLTAIDELQDEAQADSDIRLIALRVVATFKAMNAVDALSQVALYDLSATLRSKAVAMLAEFDHESVFEPIVLSCADPSREVRAAAARGLFRVTFDRADEWARFALSHDRFLATQIARAAVEGGIAERSFDRLVIRDEKAAYEAFALVFLLITTGETEKIFNAIRGHRDLKTRIALLHSLKIANIAEVVPELSAFIAAEPMSSEVADKARETLLGINAMPVGV